jgi:hypothetical protein
LKPPILFGSSIPSLDNGSPKPSGSGDRGRSLGIPLSKVGFPIRKSADQSFFAAPRGLSQRSTSFIASQRQGIHRMPLRHLIALIINAHRTRRACSIANDRRDIDEKDQLAFLRSTRRRAVKPADQKGVAHPPWRSPRRGSDRSPLHDVRQHASALRLCAGGHEFVCSRTSTGDPGWWSQTGSNRRPPACKAGALPAELWPPQYGR